MLTRKVGERVRLQLGGVTVWATVVRIDGKRVRLGFEAEPAVEIDREEVARRKQRETQRRQ